MAGFGENPPAWLLCKACSNLLKNAVSLPCCQALVCRGCAVKNIIKNKSHCFLPRCSKPISITGLKGNEKARKECEKYFDWSATSKEKKQKIINNEEQEKKNPEQNENKSNVKTRHAIIDTNLEAGKNITSKMCMNKKLDHKTASHSKTMDHKTVETIVKVESLCENEEKDLCLKSLGGNSGFRIKEEQLKYEYLEETEVMGNLLEDKKDIANIMEPVHIKKEFVLHNEGCDNVVEKNTAKSLEEIKVKIVEQTSNASNVKINEVKTEIVEESKLNMPLIKQVKGDNCFQEDEKEDISKLKNLEKKNTVEIKTEKDIDFNRQEWNNDIEKGEIIEISLDSESDENSDADDIAKITDDYDDINQKCYDIIETNTANRIPNSKEELEVEKVSTSKCKAIVLKIDDKEQLKKLRDHIGNKSCAIPSPSDMYSLHDWILHYLALAPDSLDGVCNIVWGKIYAFQDYKLSETVRQHVSSILDQYWVYDLNYRQYSLKQEAWAFIDPNWPYFSSKDRITVNSNRPKLSQKYGYVPCRVGTLMTILKDAINGFRINKVSDHILDKLAFLCRIEGDKIVLDSVAWFFVPILWMKTKLETDWINQCKNEELNNKRQNKDFRFDLIMHCLTKCNSSEETGFEYKIALLLGISEEQLLSWEIMNQHKFLPNNSEVQKSNQRISTSEDLCPSTEFSFFHDSSEKPYEYLNLFDMYSEQTIMIHMAAAATDELSSFQLSQSIEHKLNLLGSHNKEEILKSFKQQINICCETISPLSSIKLLPSLWRFVDVSWPFYSIKERAACIVNLSKVKLQISKGPEFQTSEAEKKRIYTPFEILIQILALGPCNPKFLIDMTNKKSPGFQWNSKLLNLLSKKSEHIFTLRAQFWWFVNPSWSLYSKEENRKTEKHKKLIMSMIENQKDNEPLYPDWDSDWIQHFYKIYSTMLPMCLKDGMNVFKVIHVFGLQLQEVKNTFSLIVKTYVNSDNGGAKGSTRAEFSAMEVCMKEDRSHKRPREEQLEDDQTATLNLTDLSTKKPKRDLIQDEITLSSHLVPEGDNTEKTKCSCFFVRETLCKVCPSFNVIIIENLKQTADPREVEEKITVFVRCTTKEKMTYVNFLPVRNKGSKSPKLLFDYPGYECFKVIPGIRKVFENNCTYVTLIRPKSFFGNISISAGKYVGIAQKVKVSDASAKMVPNMDTELGNQPFEVQNQKHAFIEPYLPNKLEKAKYISVRIPKLVSDLEKTNRYYQHPAVKVKIDNNQLPDLDCKVYRVTVQDKGEVILPLRNTGSRILNIKAGTVIGEVTSLITSECISIKLGRTPKETEANVVEPKEAKVIFMFCEFSLDGTINEVGCFSKHKSIESSFFATRNPKHCSKEPWYKNSFELAEKKVLEKLQCYLDEKHNQCELYLFLNHEMLYNLLCQRLGVHMLSNYFTGLMYTHSWLGNNETMIIKDLYQKTFGKIWEIETPNCLETAKYMSSIVFKLLPITNEMIQENPQKIRKFNKSSQVNHANLIHLV